MNEQKIISDSVKARGYYDGHEPVPLIARHVAKMAEELGEVGEYVGMCYEYNECPLINEFEFDLANVQVSSREAFDHGDWSEAYLANAGIDAVKSELADVLVVVMSMAQVISDHFGEFDVLVMAVEKSKADVERGVR